MLDAFHPIVRSWFKSTFGEPTPPQKLGWPGISSGRNTLILAPTGSGKTLAAFLWAINHLVEQHLDGPLTPGVRILYVSPLKALNNDIHRNLEEPLAGIRREAERQALELPGITTAVRTGDTPQSQRSAMVRNPPDILITTPESLYLMLTSVRARKIFRTVQYLIVDEIHSICGNKRGVHLSLSLERLARIAEQDFVRIGLSATQRPLEQIARFLGGQESREGAHVPRSVSIVDAGRRKDMDLAVECPVPDFSTVPADGIWPLVFDRLVEEIRNHRTTLVFVNNRRLAERISATLNDLLFGEDQDDSDDKGTDSLPSATGLYSVPVKTEWRNDQGKRKKSKEKMEDRTRSNILVQAYHGSMSREAREQMEQDLKEGRLQCLVATSSLELGIDIGSIDLVVQIQSPKGVARGLQRVGRSGHAIAATSKGRIFPTFREDLVESAVVAAAMMEHAVEYTHIPRDCLDVLAQQIVAMVSVEEWDVDELFDTIRQSYCYRELSRALYLNVLQMLAGRYTHEAFRELRARISWDKVNNRLSPLPGSSQLAITSGGTISDRGYFGVYLEDGSTKVGEVDEEFVYESRAGDTFLLGTSVWRMMEIDANRITVKPAPGEPARMPFWRGEGIGRSFELAARVGAFRRELSARLDSQDCLPWLRSAFPIDANTAWNIQEYFLRQRDITGVIPHDRLLIVEGFRDEIGDPRIVLHSPFGRRVNGLLGLLIAHRLQVIIQADAQMLYNDNGVLLRCPDMDSIPVSLLEGITLKEAEEVVLNDLTTSPLFGGQFRMNAARALLMPKIAPGKRTPLWLQRLRAGDLLQIVRQFDDFPIVIETMREVLNDVLDLNHFREIIRGIEAGEIGIHTTRTEVPSPFAASLLFDFIAVYMYEWDQPRADKFSQYLSINRELLSEVLDLDTISTMLRPDAISLVESQLQHAAEGYRARSPEELLEILLRVGDLSDDEINKRCVDGNSAIALLAGNGRAVRMTFPDGSRWIAGEERPVYERLPGQRELAHVVQRYVRTHGPVSPEAIARRYGADASAIRSLLQEAAHSSPVVRGRFRDEGDEEWCYRPNIERIHRQTIAILRKEITPSSLAEFTLFLHAWQHLSPPRRLNGAGGIQECLEQLEGVSLPSDVWEREILMRRVSGFDPSHLAQLTANGTVVWCGASAGRMRPVFRGNGALFLDGATSEADGIAEPAKRILGYIRENGASFFSDIRTGTHLSLNAMNNGIADLFWGGWITNDVFPELQQIKRPAKRETDIEPVEILSPRQNPARAKLMQGVRRALRQVPGWTGRWSLVHLPGVLGDEPDEEERAHRRAIHLLDRYGIVARELCRRETDLRWQEIATALQRMEMRGEIRRGYFVEGLSGMQFASPAAIEILRAAATDADPAPLLLNACDPANPYGPGLDLPRLRLARVPGNYLVFERGIPILAIENSGSRLWTLGETSDETMRFALRTFADMIRLPDRLRPFRQITLEQCDGRKPVRSPLEPFLREVGFYAAQNQTMKLDAYS